ncbi:hypothetical protein, partial [Kribbella koreensis]|uniref:hypothetical protein n=1 Tax=Kribbella koreensis TaxID=57909 RepID=UPI0031DB2538
AAAAAAAGWGAAGAAAGAGGGAEAAPSGGRGLAFKGVAYDVGTGFLGDDSRVRWSRGLMRGEVRAIKERLNANWVSVYGSDVQRLGETAEEALRAGLKVSVQPRAFDQPQEEALEQLRETARVVERLRGKYRQEVILVVGCEFMLFTPGIVPGADFFERVEYLTKGEFDMAELQRKLGVYVAKAVKVARSNFKGRITYGAASDLEEIDWSLFDIVGLDYYSYHADRTGHTKELAPFKRWQKPIMILEFGCCTFTGAPQLGGMGWDIVDFTVDPVQIKPGYYRDEQEQADHLRHMLEVFTEEGFLGAAMYTFISPDAPHRKERKYDEDIAAFSLCKVIRQTSSDPASKYRWEPKKSFHAVSDFYATC